MEKKGKAKGYPRKKPKLPRNKVSDDVLESIDDYGFRDHDASTTRGKNTPHPRRGSWRGNYHRSNYKNQRNYRKGCYQNGGYDNYNNYNPPWNDSYNSQFGNWHNSKVKWCDEDGMPDGDRGGNAWNKDHPFVPSLLDEPYKLSTFMMDRRQPSHMKKAAYVPPFADIQFPSKPSSFGSNMTSSTPSLTTVSPSSSRSGHAIASSSVSAVSSTTPSITSVDSLLDHTSGLSSTAAALRQRIKSATESEEHAKDSHSMELSQKASEIIDSILKGEKVPSRSVEAAQSGNSHNGEDVIDKAERLCQKLRVERDQARQKQENAKLQATEEVNRQKLMSSVHRSRESSCSSSGGSYLKNLTTATTSLTEKSPINVTSPLRPATGPHCQISQRLTTSKSASLRNAILQMFKYPKSRRGTSQVERLLQQSKVTDASRQRLINLMNPLSEPEKQELDFLQLTPDVQEHILSLVDEVMMEMESEAEVPMPDEGVLDSSSFGHQDGTNMSSSTRRPISASDHRMPSVSAGLVDIPDVKHHFENLLTGNVLLQAVSNTTFCTTTNNNLSAPTTAALAQHTAQNTNMLNPDDGVSHQESFVPASIAVKCEQVMDSTGRQPEDPSAILYVRDKTASLLDARCSTPSTSNSRGAKLITSGVSTTTTSTSDVQDSLPGTTDVAVSAAKMSDAVSKTPNASSVRNKIFTASDVRSSSSDVNGSTPKTSNVKGSTSEVKRIQISQSQKPAAQVQNVSNLKSLSCEHNDSVRPCVTHIKPEPKDMSYETATGSSAVLSCDKTSSQNNISATIDSVINKSYEQSVTVAMDTTEETGTSDGVKKVNTTNKPRTKRPREKTTTKTSKSKPCVSSDNAVTKRPKVNDNADAPSTDSVVEELYTIALEEDDLHGKMTETDQAIKELQALLDSTKARLEYRQKYRKELEEREAQLRKQRLNLLEDARNSSRRTSVELVNSSSPSNGPTKTKKKPTTKKPKLVKVADTNDNDVVEPDTTVNSSACAVEADGTVEKTTNSGPEKTKRSLKQKVPKKPLTDDVCPDTATSLPKVEISTSDSQANPSSNMSIKYLGSFVSEDDVQSVLKHLSQNFKNLKPVSSLELGDGIKVDLVELGAGSKESGGASQELDIASKSSTDGAQFRQPEVGTSKSVKTAVKTKKVVKKKAKSQENPSLDSESETNMRPKERKAPKKKKKDKGTSKIIKEYLYCSSSSDVDLDGLQITSSHMTGTTKLVPKPQMIDCSSEDSESSDDPLEYISLQSEGRSNRKVKNIVPVGGVFSEVMKGPVSCLVTWRRYLLATGQETHVKYLIKNKPQDGPAKILCNHIDQIKVLHVSSGQDQSGSVYLFTGSLDKSLVITNFNTGVYMSQHQCPAPIKCGSPGWGRLYLGLDDGSLVTFDIQRYRIEHTYPAANSAIVQIATGQEGARRLICICEQDQPLITLRDARNKLFIRSLEGHTKTPDVLKVKNHFLYSGGADNMVQIHNIVTGNMESLMRFQSAVTQIVVSNMLIVGEKRGLISIIQHKDQIRERVIYTYDQSPVTALLFDKPQNMLYIGEETGRLEAVSTATQSFKCQFSLCSGYAFGQQNHMLRHLIMDHVAPCIKGKVLGIDVEQLPHIFRCLWKDCKDYIYIKNSTREAEEHMSFHVNEIFSASS